TGLADVGQSLTPGTPIAEILDPNDIFVDWYIPNERLMDPKVGYDVVVVFGNRANPAGLCRIHRAAAARGARPSGNADRAHPLRQGRVTAAAQHNGRRSHALQRVFLARRRRAGLGVRALLT